MYYQEVNPYFNVLWTISPYHYMLQYAYSAPVS